MNHKFAWLIAIALLAALSYGGCQILIINGHLSLVPAEMGVRRIIYVSEKNWVFGPGGNETGLIVYSMPDSSLAKLSTGGLDYLNGLSSRQTKAERLSHYPMWRMTPIGIENE